MVKKKTHSSQTLSPEKYIKEKARMLPVSACYRDKNWKEGGLVTILVVRRHPKETYTYGCYLVDMFCLGVKESFYEFSLSDIDLESLLRSYREKCDLEQVSYEEVHNMIYGAVAFAEEAGISPDKSFALTRYLLEEDTDDIPLIDYEYGRDGMHFLMAENRLELSKYQPLLEKNLGTGHYKYVVEEDDEPDEDEENDNDFDFSEMMENMGNLFMSQEESAYTYIHPEYPAVLDVENQWLVSLFYDVDNQASLPEDKIKEVLSLPHDSLKHDLEQITLFETGRTCEDIPEERWNEDYAAPLLHTLFFLGEVGDGDSLEVVLETLRQNLDYYDFHFGDSRNEVYVPTLYLLGKDRLPTLLSYMKEPGLYTFARCMVSPAVALVARMYPERRSEVIDWFRNLLQFYVEELPRKICCDGTLVGLIMSDLMDLHASELLPEIKAVFATGEVDEGCVGDYSAVEKEILNLSSGWLRDVYKTDIYERYEDYSKMWKK